MKNRLTHISLKKHIPTKRVLAAIGASLFLAAAWSSQAALYDVNRTWTDGVDTATLTGTVDIPIGNYTLMNADASPFTSVNLTLTAKGSTSVLTLVDTVLIHGTAQFLISATPTELIFNAANANGSNPADLFFNSATHSYVIGYDGLPGFEVAKTPAGAVLESVTLPVVFGLAAVPEPSTYLAGISALGMLGIFSWRNRR